MLEVSAGAGPLFAEAGMTKAAMGRKLRRRSDGDAEGRTESVVSGGGGAFWFQSRGMRRRGERVPSGVEDRLIELPHPSLDGGQPSVR